MRGLSDFEQLHEVLEGNGVFELKCSLADVLKMLGRDEVTDPIEDILEGFLVNFSVLRMEVEDLHEGLSLGCFDGKLMFPRLFILQH